MNRKEIRFFILIGAVLLAVSSSSANMIKFKLSVVDDESTAEVEDAILDVGETVDVVVQAWVDSGYGTANNGLDSWEMDLIADVTGVISVSDVVMIAPDPDDWGGYSSINDLTTGSIEAVTVSQQNIGGPSSTSTGIGGYSDIFSFKVTGLAEGEAVYSMSGQWYAFLADGEWFENDAAADGGVYFEGASFEVVPEPCSLMIMSGLSVLAFSRRRRS